MRKACAVLGLLALVAAACTAAPGESLPLPQVWAGTPVPTVTEAISVESAEMVQEVARWGWGPISEIAWSKI